MKSLWTILATLAIANLLALAGFVGWLAASDRLSRERVEKIRLILAPTLAEDQAAADAKAEEDKKGAADAAEKQRLAGPPESATEKIDQNRAENDKRQEQAARLRKEIDDLRRRLLADQEKLDDERRSFDAERKAFLAQRDDATKLTTSEQFKQALGTLEAQKSRDAQQVLKSLIDSQQKPMVVEYLAAMGDRPRGKILAEFIKDDAKLAAELLERLRARGVAVAAASPAP